MNKSGKIISILGRILQHWTVFLLFLSQIDDEWQIEFGILTEKML